MAFKHKWLTKQKHAFMVQLPLMGHVRLPQGTRTALVLGAPHHNAPRTLHASHAARLRLAPPRFELREQQKEVNEFAQQKRVRFFPLRTKRNRTSVSCTVDHERSRIGKRRKKTKEELRLDATKSEPTQFAKVLSCQKANITRRPIHSVRADAAENAWTSSDSPTAPRKRNRKSVGGEQVISDFAPRARLPSAGLPFSS